MFTFSSSSFYATHIGLSKPAHYPPQYSRFSHISPPQQPCGRHTPFSTAYHPSVKWAAVDGPEITREQAAAIARLPPKMTKRCRALMKQLICFSSEEFDSLSLLLSSWVKAMKPRRADWLSVLKELELSEGKENFNLLFLQVFQFALLEDSFEANPRDYTKIMGFLSQMGRFRDAEAVFLAMQERDIPPDQITMTLMVNLYSKAGLFDRAEQAFQKIKLMTGDNPDRRAYGAMVMACVRAGRVEEGEKILGEMDSREMSACREVYKAVLRAYAMAGDWAGAQRVFDAVQLAGVVPDARLCALLMHAYGAGGQPAAVVSVLDNMRVAGVQPNDKCVALVVGAMREEGKLEKAMGLLEDLERDGILIGSETSAVLESWFRQLGLSEELSGFLPRS